MNGSAQEIALLVIELMGALALAVLWLGDRERSYTLWWAIASAAQPFAALVAGLTRTDPPTTDPVHLLICALLATQAVGLLAGVISYRTARLRPTHAAAAVLLLTGLIFIPILWFGASWGRAVAALSMASALMASAALMWSLGRYERFAAVCFALRGMLNMALLALIAAGHSNSSWFSHFAGFNAPMIMGTALALLIAAYQRSLDRLRDQYRIVELSQQITAQLQGVSDEAELAQRALTVIALRLGWTQGLFLRPTSEPLSFFPIASFGLVPGPINQGAPIKTSQGGLISMAMSTRSVTYSIDVADDPRVSAIYRNHPSVTGFHSQVVIPVTHDGQPLGAIMVRDVRRRELHVAEIRALESLGQVIGLSLTNAHNLRELAHRANHDALTGLGNRAALHDYLRSRAGDRCAVLLFDLDRFKQVNDALGHAVGDKLLCAMAEQLEQYLDGRPAQLFRLGGDEFVIIHALNGDTTQREVLTMARELAAVIAKPLQIGEFSLRAPASIGVALAPDHGDNSHELLRCADVAMYHAKNNGLGEALYEREIDAYKLEHLTLLSAVNEGLGKGQFALFYQPIINLRTGAIEGCEGLIRWHHPTLGLIGASEFMPLVEATDLIRALTHYVIDIAMADAARWQQRGIDSRIAINLSARNILDPELPDYLLNTAMQHKVEPTRIQLELTETILMKDPAAAGKVLQKLAQAGFSLALDDFGTGYSSLAYLARFPIHTLKIDRSFVREMLAHAQSRAIVESTIALARGLGLKVTAEGVELEAEAQLLRELGCDCAQGFLFSYPIPEAQLMEEWQRIGSAITK